MKKEENLGGIGVVLRESEEEEVIVADVKILEFRKKFCRPSDQQELRIFKDDFQEKLQAPAAIHGYHPPDSTLFVCLFVCFGRA